MRIPAYEKRTPEDIASAEHQCDSAWHVWQALSWLDYAKRQSSTTAVQYAALELRQGIEYLWFDMIVTALGGKLDIAAYRRCRGESTKMYKILERLSPDYVKLVRFTLICGTHGPAQPAIIEWDIPALKRWHGEVSQYLHFIGTAGETTASAKWFVHALSTIDAGTQYIWQRLTKAHTGLLSIASMPPEVKDAWEQFKTGQINEADVRMRLRLAEPVLTMRRKMR